MTNHKFTDADIDLITEKVVARIRRELRETERLLGEPRKSAYEGLSKEQIVDRMSIGASDGR